MVRVVRGNCILDQEERILDAGERVVDLVCHASGDAADGRERVEALRRGVRSPARRHVTRLEEQLRHPATGLFHRLDGDLENHRLGTVFGNFLVVAHEAAARRQRQVFAQPRLLHCGTSPPHRVAKKTAPDVGGPFPCALEGGAVHFENAARGVEKKLKLEAEVEARAKPEIARGARSLPPAEFRSDGNCQRRAYNEAPDEHAQQNRRHQDWGCKGESRKNRNVGSHAAARTRRLDAERTVDKTDFLV